MSAIHILLVEDEKATATAMAMMLRNAAAKEGVEIVVDVVHTMADARSRAERADCVLLDLGLPDSLRDETVERLPQLAEVWPPIIVVSSFVSLSDSDPSVRSLFWRVVDFGADNVHEKAEALANPHLLLRNIRMAVRKRMVLNRRKVHAE